MLIKTGRCEFKLMSQGYIVQWIVLQGWLSNALRKEEGEIQHHVVSWITITQYYELNTEAIVGKNVHRCL